MQLLKKCKVLFNKERLLNSSIYRSIPVAQKHKKIISHKKQFIFYIIPKVASTSLEQTLRKQPELTDLQLIKTPSHLLVNRYKDYFTYAFVRNPWSRVVSAYENKVCHERRELIEGYFKRYPELYYKMPFEEFVEYLCGDSGHDSVTNIHWMSQHLFISFEGKLIPSFIGKFENMQKDFDIVRDRLGLIQVSMEEKNRGKSKSNPKKYIEYYNPRTKKLIADRYEKDIELFSYRFDS